MPFARLAPGLTAEQLVAALGDPHRSSEALWRLIALGPDAAVPARDGLSHPDLRVRVNCCKVLDHVMGQDDLAAVIGALADPEPEVRWNALHALACDRCKAGECRPSAAAVLPPALALLTADPSPRVRAGACEVVGAWAHSRREAAAALQVSAGTDPSPAVRKKASWYAPGGPIFRRTRPKPQRPR
ncbi:MAG TPA: HEAT repeat domain-containing protein [Trebonia sp.]|nr:HEAT repeat domain-containing protein [Trebonia sp.]